MGVLLFRLAVFKMRFGGPQVALEKDPRDHQENRGFIIFPPDPSAYRMMTERGTNVVVKHIVSHDGP